VVNATVAAHVAQVIHAAGCTINRPLFAGAP
jgi:hypothetical protein